MMDISWRILSLDFSCTIQYRNIQVIAKEISSLHQTDSLEETPPLFKTYKDRYNKKNVVIFIC
jgi:hypothetical protein